MHPEQHLLDDPENRRDDEAAERSDRGNLEFVAAVFGSLDQMRHPAEDEQRDAGDVLAQAVSQRGVREFMAKHRGEKQHGADRADDPVAGECMARDISRGKYPAERLHHTSTAMTIQE